MVNTYGMDVTKAYTMETYRTDTASPYYILTNNDALSNGVKLVVGDIDVNLLLISVALLRLTHSDNSRMSRSIYCDVGSPK